MEALNNAKEGIALYLEPMVSGLKHDDEILTDSSRWPTTGGLIGGSLLQEKENRAEKDIS